MLDSRHVELSKYRLSKAEETLATARRDFHAGDFASANNRAYYSFFHAMRAVLALDGEDFKKHSAVISRFSQRYLKTDIIPRQYGSCITSASLIRNRSDYEDFYICSIEETRDLLQDAEGFVSEIKKYLDGQY